jgi:hypothetical protein
MSYSDTLGESRKWRGTNLEIARKSSTKIQTISTEDAQETSKELERSSKGTAD